MLANVAGLRQSAHQHEKTQRLVHHRPQRAGIEVFGTAL